MSNRAFSPQLTPCCTAFLRDTCLREVLRSVKCLTAAVCTFFLQRHCTPSLTTGLSIFMWWWSAVCVGMHGNVRNITDISRWGVQSSTASAVLADCSSCIVGCLLLSLLHSATTAQDAYYRKELMVGKLTSFNLSPQFLLIFLFFLLVVFSCEMLSWREEIWWELRYLEEQP